MYVYRHWLYSRIFLCSFGSVLHYICPPLDMAWAPGHCPNVAALAHYTPSEFLDGWSTVGAVISTAPPLI